MTLRVIFSGCWRCLFLGQGRSEGHAVTGGDDCQHGQGDGDLNRPGFSGHSTDLVMRYVSWLMLLSAASRTVYGSPSIVRLSANTGSAYPHARSNTYPRRPYASMGCYAHARGTNPNTGCNTDSRRTDTRGRYGSGRPRYAAFRHADCFAVNNRTGRRSQER